MLFRNRRSIMKRKTLKLLLTITCAFSLSACGSAASQTEEAATVTQTEEITTDESVQSTQEQEADSIVDYESPLGYTVQYNQDMFTLTSGSDYDRFEYSGDMEPDAPIYVAVQLYTDMDAETVANGIVLQSGRDDVTVSDGTFGEEIEAKIIHYEEEAEGITRTYSYFAIPKGDGCLLLEAGEYLGIPGYEIDGNIELIIDSFIPNED
jgi:hypothetical protein